MRKFLVIRFSSIGDIVLTSPVLRNLRIAYPEARIDFVTKRNFQFAIENNPHIDQVHYLDNDIGALIFDLKQRDYDTIIDLHNNIRSKQISKAFRGRNIRVLDKKNIKKWLLVNFKIDKLGNQHIVDRYLKTIESEVPNPDKEGLEYFLSINDTVNLREYSLAKDNFIAVVVGGSFSTKQYPAQKHIEWIQKYQGKIVLLGGKEDQNISKPIKEACSHVIDLCGALSFNESAYIISQARKVITNDTGLMHVAAAFDKEIISIWGNTTPSIGMTPFGIALEKNHIIEEKVSCRPCSKLGHNKCPKKHFDCMEKISNQKILQHL